jgi:hexosaminidase
MINVIPAPVRVEELSMGGFALDETVGIVFASPDLPVVAEQFVEDLQAQTGVLLKAVSSGTTRSIRLELVAGDLGLGALPATGGIRPDDGDAAIERYGLEVRPDSVRVWAIAPEGIYRGLTTLRQLAGTGRELPAVHVTDAPRFSWRGFSLDTSRSFWSVDQVKQMIDLLALYKFNVLHLHLTDSEGWRIQIDSRLALTEIGSQGALGDRPGGFYTKAEYADLVAYAAQRFITIVPEIDVPGHAVAILKSCPELAGDGSVSSAEEFRQLPGMLQYLHPANPNLIPFLTDVISEVAAMTPGPYLHIGGDEPFGMPDDLYKQFIPLARTIAYAQGKKVVCWQEAARAGIGESDIAQYWFKYDPGLFNQIDPSSPPEDIHLPDRPPLSPEVLKELMAALSKAVGDVEKARAVGSKVLVSLTSKAYLDTPYKEDSADPAQEAELSRLGMPFYPKSTIEEFLDWDPAMIHETIDEAHVAGVEAAIWCETIVTFDDLLFQLLPRLPGVAERGWSPTGITEWSNYGPRLASQAPLWRQRNWNFFQSSLVEWSWS